MASPTGGKPQLYYTDLASKVIARIKKLNMDPHLITLLARALRHEPNTRQELQKLTNFPYEKYEILIRHQNAIGWDLIHLGRLS